MEAVAYTENVSRKMVVFGLRQLRFLKRNLQVTDASILEMPLVQISFYRLTVIKLQNFTSLVVCKC